jgi:hypothetical protein
MIIRFQAPTFCHQSITCEHIGVSIALSEPWPVDVYLPDGQSTGHFFANDALMQAKVVRRRCGLHAFANKISMIRPTVSAFSSTSKLSFVGLYARKSKFAFTCRMYWSVTPKIACTAQLRRGAGQPVCHFKTSGLRFAFLPFYPFANFACLPILQ